MMRNWKMKYSWIILQEEEEPPMAVCGMLRRVV
jgi:hypothetical protein